MRRVIVFISILLYQFSFAQEKTIDSLENLSFEVLEKQFKKTFVDTIIDIQYAKAYLKKSKKQNDSIKMANAYFYLSESFPLKKGLVYSDSIILSTKILQEIKHTLHWHIFKRENYFIYLGNMLVLYLNFLLL